MSLRRLLSLAAAVVLAAIAFPAGLHAQSDVIRGRITGPDSLPVERATITVTSLNGNITRNARTDKNGRFSIVFPGDEGDYMVNVAALGFTAKRFEIKRTADQDILIADARLQRSAAQLDAVKVQAERQRVGRDGMNQMDIGGSERNINSGAVSADQLGDLAALAASMPGVQLIPSADGSSSGFSVLGLGADQNATTLNGMNFGGSALPRDAMVSTSLATAPYDVSRGNFSGGMLSIRTGRASNYIIRTSSLNIDAPATQWTDRAGRSLNQQYTNLSLGGLVAGPIKPDKAFFNLSYQLGRRQSGLQSLLNTDAVGLQAAGISADSANRLQSILAGLNVPMSVGSVPSNRYNDQAMVFGSMDFMPPSSLTGQAFNVTFNGSFNRSTAVTMSPTELPAHSGNRASWNAGLQARHTNYYGFLLSETSLGLSGNSSYGSPYLQTPSGSVLLNSTFDDASPSVQLVSFGGNPSLSTSNTNVTAQLQNALSWFSENNKHRLKFTTELRRDSYGLDMTTNRFGSFSYASLEDLEAGIPASFTRSLSPRKRSGSEYIAALSLGDSYRPTTDLQVQYGVRVDGNKFAQSPLLNPGIEGLFDVSNTNVPNKVYVSPRVGFSWTYGQASEIPGFIGAMRGPRAVVRGGVGVFQNTPSVTLIGSAMDNTGLPSGVQQLNCVGEAVPIPDWASYANGGVVPSTCADGTTGTVYSSTSPSVTLFDKDYAAPRSLRSNLSWSGNVLHNRFAASVDATYSLNLNQASSIDLNFDPQQQFTLANEGNRPIFAQASSIVPTSGAIAPSESRVSTDYTHVTSMRSDLRSESKQLSFRLSPTAFNSTMSWGLSYTYAQTRDQYRGFSSTTGNPLDVAWGRSGFDSRHQITYNLTYNAFDWVRIGWNGSFRSGSPFTPTITGDVNGDGYTNDRAFIFNPSDVGTDATVAAGMQSLLANGSKSARECLNAQLGKLATRNSCQGPWTTSANLQFSFNPIKVRMPQRATLSFSLSNPLGAADMLLHGTGGMRGWGQNPLPSNQLLFVRGFDPAQQRYKYEVNQRFGATAVGQTISRNPVVLTTMLRFDIGPTRERQQLTQMLDRGRKLDGNKAPEAMFKALGPIGITNPMAAILREADTLQLTSDQADSIAVLNRTFTIKLDSVWTPIARYLAALPDDYDQSEAYGRYRTAREVSVDALMKLAPAVKALLTEDQLHRLSSYISPFLDQRYLASVRSGSAGTGLGMMMMPGGMAMPAGGNVMMSGGGGGITVIRIGTP